MSSEDILSQAPLPADVRVSYGGDPQQFVEVRIPHKTEVIPSERERVEGSAFAPIAICIHGGFWRAKYDLVHAGHMCAALTKPGVATLNVEYRRVGNGGGWPESLSDIQTALKFLPKVAEEYRLDLNRIIIIGHSAGGQLALALAAHQTSLRGVVALAPVSDLRRAYNLHLSNDAVVEFLGGTPSEVPQKYAEASPLDLPIAIPQVIIHGLRDDTVPIEMSCSYSETKQKRGESVTLIEPDCGHFELIDPDSRAWADVEKAVLELLKP